VARSVVVPLYSPVRLIAEIAPADAMSGGRLMLGIGAEHLDRLAAIIINGEENMQ